jgi:hypothetical protein
MISFSGQWIITIKNVQWLQNKLVRLRLKIIFASFYHGGSRGSLKYKTRVKKKEKHASLLYQMVDTFTITFLKKFAPKQISML